jgi:Lar family restriction alleviation protein
MTEELKPCPSCGGESVRHDRVSRLTICNKCGAEGPTCLHNGTAVEQWNERLPPKYKDYLTYRTSNDCYILKPRGDV